jgi:diketogulonate reductase-like aldo/keto reductase
MAEKKFKLNTGAEIPALGLGTWQSAAGEVENAVGYALSVGYKHIDAGVYSEQLISRKERSKVVLTFHSILLWERRRSWGRPKNCIRWRT